MSVAESTIGQSNMVFDRVLAYALGQAGETEKAQVEVMLASGNSAYVESHQHVQELLGHLPSVLAPVVPPPFLKDKIMAKIGEPPINAMPDKAPAPSVRGFGRFVNSFGLLKRTAVFAGLLIGGVFVSAYTVEQMLDKSAITYHASQSNQSSSAKQNFDYRGAARTIGEQQLTEAVPIEGPMAVLSEEGHVRSNNLASGTPSPDGTSGHMQTNFGLTQAYINLMSEQSALEYQLTPATSYLTGNGRVIWDETHSDALLVISKLQPNSTSSHYVLWYMHDGSTPERMLNFNAASQARMSFFVNHAPGAHVSGVMITLERVNNGRLESQEILRAATKEKAHS